MGHATLVSRRWILSPGKPAWLTGLVQKKAIQLKG
jgi:hypothetical protein